ncbi:hypothetical protein VVR12_03230 [Rothia sp. LK2588]|uniref:hypothetical protein n=1 Tax=Rothia sp. LK2588 TaxID=3114369 RepID=UPI0034CD829C
MMDMFAPQASTSAKFPNPGDTVAGEILEIGEPVQARKYGTQEPDFWPSGDPIMQAKITLQTQDRDPSNPEDDGKRGLWVTQSGKAGGQLAAIRDAVREAGEQTIKVGGFLQVQFTGHDPESKNPANPRKLYAARYEGPAAGGGMFGVSAPAQGAQQAQQAPQGQQNQPQGQAGFQQHPQSQPQQSFQQQAPAQTPQQGLDPEIESRIKALIGMNIDTAAIVNSMAHPAVTADVVDSYRG